MANVLGQNPMILDTPAVISPDQLFVLRKLQYIGTATGNDAIFKDGAGREIAHLSSPGPEAPDSIDFDRSPKYVVKGLELASISSGVAHVYYL